MKRLESTYFLSFGFCLAWYRLTLPLELLAITFVIVDSDQLNES
jgi:hypothetical protein